MEKEFRVGFGFDVHKFSDKRRLILGGVDIPYEYGLYGHSDADVVTHSVIDALLGATGNGDIGEEFPDNNPSYKDINSITLLKIIYDKYIKDKFFIINIDVTVVCEKPKLKKFKDKMRLKIAESLNIDYSRVNIKATTTERLGFTGREEGVASYAVCSIKEI